MLFFGTFEIHEQVAFRVFIVKSNISMVTMYNMELYTAAE
jgi:hypothetical protein